MKRKIVTLLFVCCLGISVAACGNETTDTKEYGEASDNELTIDEDDSEDEDYAETLGNSSSVSTNNNSSEETHGYDPSDPYYSAHDTDGDGQLTDEEWSAAMGDFIDDLAEQMGVE